MCSERCRYFGTGMKMASQLLGYIPSGGVRREDSSAEYSEHATTVPGLV